MSRKPCSSNSEHSHSADSTSASGVALPYFCRSRLSSEPAFTPIRIGVPASVAALAISATLSSNSLMLPGLTRTAAHPALIAANTYFGWKWISAITGILDLRAICGSASASSCDGTATLTIWQPAAVSSAICCRVAFTSAVSVVAIDCTLTGAPPPTGTLPTMSRRDCRRSASGAAGTSGMPRSTLICFPIPFDRREVPLCLGGTVPQDAVTRDTTYLRTVPLSPTTVVPWRRTLTPTSCRNETSATPSPPVHLPRSSDSGGTAGRAGSGAGGGGWVSRCLPGSRCRRG